MHWKCEFKYHLLIPVVFWKTYDFIYVYIMTRHPSFFSVHKNDIDGFGNAISSEAACFVIYAILTISVATLSAICIERPFSRLKVSYTGTLCARQ